MNAVLTEQTPAQLAKGCEAINRLEAELAKCLPCEYQLVHRFTPGLYTREWSAKAGVLCTSKIHRTEHQFIISKGSAMIWTDGVGWKLFQAPHHGITKPGTRRVLHILEDIIFTTCHATNKTSAEEIEADLVEPDERLENLKEQQAREALK